MPEAKCPICERIWDLTVADEAAWYRDRFPWHNVGDVVPLVCFECGPEIRVGDVVTVRRVPNDDRTKSRAPADVGTIVATRTESDGEISFCVERRAKHKSAASWFKRSDLFFTPYAEDQD